MARQKRNIPEYAEYKEMALLLYYLILLWFNLSGSSAPHRQSFIPLWGTGRELENGKSCGMR